MIWSAGKVTEGMIVSDSYRNMKFLTAIDTANEKGVSVLITSNKVPVRIYPGDTLATVLDRYMYVRASILNAKELADK